MAIALTPERIRKPLERAGLTLSTMAAANHSALHWRAHKQYRIKMTAMCVHACYARICRSGLSDVWQWMEKKDDPRLFRRLEQIAQRVCYTLELEHADIELVKEGERELHIGIVVPLRKKRYDALSDIVSPAIPSHAIPKPREVLIGMDPEFLLLRANGKVAMASAYVDRAGKVGCDSVRVRGRLLFPLVELRPAPDANPHVVVGRLREALHMASTRIRDEGLTWLAGGMPVVGLALGGHLHISGVPFSSELVRALDNYVALSFAMVEGEHTRRRRPKYGFLGDFRHKRHGGFEYRTLPSWLVSPLYARAAVAMCKLVVDHADQLTLRPFARDDLQDAYYAGNKSMLLPYVRECWDDLKRLGDYEALATYLEPFRRAVLALEIWPESVDIRKGWHIGPYSRFVATNGRRS